MDDLHIIELKDHRVKTDDTNLAANANDIRRGPGAPKKENPRVVKVSCRLTAKERALGLKYCKAHGTTEAKLLRAGYLTAITQPPSDRMKKLLDALMPLDDLDLSPAQQMAVRIRASDTLKKSAALLLLILLGCSSVHLVAKYHWSGWANPGNRLNLDGNQACIFGPDLHGCTVYEIRP